MEREDDQSPHISWPQEYSERTGDNYNGASVSTIDQTRDEARDEQNRF